MAGAAPDQFVTGLILRIRLADGAVDIVNAGHPPPYLLRSGAAGVIAVTPGLPFGVGRDPYGAKRLDLEAGERLLIVTDGFLERNGNLAVGDILEHSADRHPREVVASLPEICSPRPAATYATTPPSSASTGSARAVFATPPEEPASIGLREASRRSPFERGTGVPLKDRQAGSDAVTEWLTSAAHFGSGDGAPRR